MSGGTVAPRPAGGRRWVRPVLGVLTAAATSAPPDVAVGRVVLGAAAQQGRRGQVAGVAARYAAGRPTVANARRTSR